MDMSITKTSSALTIHWSEGDAGGGPVTGYVVETRASGKPSEGGERFACAVWEVRSCLTLTQHAAFIRFINTRCAIKSAAIF